MRHRNELLVGTVVVLALLSGYAGTRFLQGLPLFGSGYTLVGVFEDAQGLTPGNAVRVSGVRVGQVAAVRLAPSADRVFARLQIDPDVVIPSGAELTLGGIAALGDVNVAILPGPPGGPPMRSGDTLFAAPNADLFAALQRDAPELIDQAGGLLASASGTMTSAGNLLGDDGDLHQTLAALRAATVAVSQMLAAERERFAATVAHLEEASRGAAAISSDLARFTSSQSDSLAVLVHSLNHALIRVDGTLQQLDGTTGQLEGALTKMNEGEGTLGLLLNDPELYQNLNGSLGGLNRVLVDFQENPGKYLRELRLVKVF